MTRYRATLAYDGAAYQGYQRQAGDTPTIQATVEAAIAQITGQTVTIIAAGRTDTGVHARGQVIAFDIAWKRDQSTLMRALNAVLPDDIAIHALSVATPEFHPRYDARAREYVYTLIQAGQRQPLWRHHAWVITQSLQFEWMRQAAMHLIGEHDFAAFGHPPQGENTVRHVFRSEWTVEQHPFGWEYRYRVEATAFLHHMVRRMVGLQVDVGRGWITPQDFTDIFASRDIARVKTLAPQQGLVLEHVRYEG